MTENTVLKCDCLDFSTNSVIYSKVIIIGEFAPKLRQSQFSKKQYLPYGKFPHFSW